MAFIPEQLIELVNTNTKGRKIPIGKIDLLKSFSFFEVESGYADDLIKALNNTKFMNQRVAVEVAQAKTDKPLNEEYGGKKSAKRFERKFEKRRPRQAHKTA